MRKIIPSILLFGLLALIGGYLSFGKGSGYYLEIARLLRPAGNVFESWGEWRKCGATS
jgi:hypothetical protein